MDIQLDVQPLHIGQLQTPRPTGGEARAGSKRLSEIQPDAGKLLRHRETARDRTASEAEVTWLRVVGCRPASLVRFLTAQKISEELARLPREAMVTLARAAEGSMPADGPDAVTAIRRLRDEWDASPD